MRYLALATDYDGTIATHGSVEPAVVKTLEALSASGRKLILVTGRELVDLCQVFPEYTIFDRIVAENGAVVFNPKTKEERCLCEEPSDLLITALRQIKIDPLSIGRRIIATHVPNDVPMLKKIRELGLEMQIIFNKGAVMVLPSGINKWTGLQAALLELGLSNHNVVGVGDAENDHAFMSACEFCVAVSNALPAVKERADFVTEGDRGRGVIQLIERMLADDLASMSPTRHFISLGKRMETAEEVKIDPGNTGILICGVSGGGKSSATLGIIDRLSKGGYQFCLIDPEGDYEPFDNAIVLGDAHRAPIMDELFQLLSGPDRSAIVNLLGVALEDRPGLFTSLLPKLLELRGTYARPHWIVVDEAHHLFPSEWQKASVISPKDLRPIVMITVHPERVAPEILKSVDVVIAVGDRPDETMRGFARSCSIKYNGPSLAKRLPKGQGLVWFRQTEEPAEVVELELSDLDRIRHKRKYAAGELPEHCSFYFRGPDSRLNLRVQNLTLFTQIADGVDDDTWMHHLAQRDYSRWFREIIKDDELAAEAAKVEAQKDISPRESRARIRAAIEERYTAPA